MSDRVFEALVGEFGRVFDRIPKRGPSQDESEFCDPDEAAVMRAIESGCDELRVKATALFC